MNVGALYGERLGDTIARAASGVGVSTASGRSFPKRLTSTNFVQTNPGKPSAARQAVAIDAMQTLRTVQAGDSTAIPLTLLM